jgi:hypothetical protein
VNEDSPSMNQTKIAESLFRFSRYKCVSINIKEPSLLFTSRFPEGVIRLTDLNVHKADVRQQRTPAFARKAAGDSSSP